MEKVQRPKVSVLIPAYNEEKYIALTLAAIAKQDYQNYEAIIINNASTDKTEEVIENFLNENPNLREIISVITETNKGTNYAREAGRKFASGEIIAQLDADCIPNADWITNGVNLLQKQGIVAVTGPYDYYDSFKWRRYSSLIAQMIFYPVIDTCAQFFERGGIIIGGNAFIYASVLELVGGYNTSLTFYGDDIDIAKRIFFRGRILYANSLIMKSSTRRFKALGFSKVQKKYRKAFLDLIFFNGIKVEESIELIHPR
jgi:glycosyltransferase involved in cell wall biosynthesis